MEQNRVQKVLSTNKEAVYLDQSRYPKVVTNGYERLFKLNYRKTIRSIAKNLASEMFKMLK